ncbi:hypothetical protein ASPZODRAFT_138260 [Penicilliopsis zonata CBS 506.65]|uniref:Uncharacterized protein n=1 Tax=Penicilliopsis zonata CBS 506.65 TaxID=1073090 RepID=A0A1L9SVD3_9EURO|nr:hypothetical protein ASPZODRAFT_138260 [Penicilliopsis zonata CBS 506.65]OJJ51148.1 hypothetical protein ASPZODRAFT_138260 [Penicilliopsis zonata CBS 506.65]
MAIKLCTQIIRSPSARSIFISSTRLLSSFEKPSPSKAVNVDESKSGEMENGSTGKHQILSKTKTVAEADAELRERLEQMSGGGGASGIEYEDGKPTAMKRGVRDNMFRLI